MLDRIFALWDSLLQLTAMIVIARYVFFEKPLSPKKQKIFYAVSYSIIIISEIFLTADTVSLLAMLLMALNIILARKKRKVLGALLVIPILGIAAGLFMPIMYMPRVLFELNGTAGYIYQAIVYGTLTILALIAFFNRKKINNSLNYDPETRTLHKWERTLLILIGIILIFAVNFFAIPELDTAKNPEETYAALVTTIFIMGLISLLMAILAIITIVEGNKQSFYQKRVNDMQFNIIVMMADLVENRDANTGGHIKRTAKYVEIIAKKLKSMGKFPNELTNEYIADIIVAAPLHDIGKIHVSDLVLNKNGRLSDEEFEIMKSHAPEGKNILEHAREQIGDFSYLDIAVQMAGSHHEWWDGNKRGYPLGTSGNDIPLSARIMAVADVFDALTSKRVYKEPMPSEKAYSIIMEESGTHFDPVIIEAFCAAKDEINEALDKFMAE